MKRKSRRLGQIERLESREMFSVTVVEKEVNDTKKVAQFTQVDPADQAMVISGAINSLKDEDFYLFASSDAAKAKVTFSGLAGFQGKVGIEDDFGLKLLETEPKDGVNSGSFNIAAGQRLFIRVRGLGKTTGSYNVTMDLDPLPAGSAGSGSFAHHLFEDSVGLYDSSSGTVIQYDDSSSSSSKSFAYGPGNSTLTPLSGDWNGDGVKSVGLYNRATGVFFLKDDNSTGSADRTFVFGPGGAGYTPIVGDWNGDGVETVGLHKSGNFVLRDDNSTGFADKSFVFGSGSDDQSVVVGDWDGNRSDTIGLRSKSSGVVFISNQNTTKTADQSFVFGSGSPNLTPISGDWNSDGRDSLGLFDDSTGMFHMRHSLSSGVADDSFNSGRRGKNFKPISGDWNGPQPPAATGANVLVEKEPNDRAFTGQIADLGADGLLQIQGVSSSKDDKDFFRLTPTVSGTLRLSVTQSTGLAKLSVEDQAGIKFAETEPNNGVHTASFNVVAGKTYFIRMRSANAAPAPYLVDLALA